jgi:hypothetical protein
MALHHIVPDQTINGKRFSVIQDFDRVRLCVRKRHMIDGKPVKKEVFEAAMKAAKAEAK